jgi:hypothetical protein
LIDNSQCLPNKLWDGVLGKHWDLLRDVKHGAAVVKTMRLNVHEDYLLKNLRVQFHLIDGQYDEESYRDIVFANSIASKAAVLGTRSDEIV